MKNWLTVKLFTMGMMIGSVLTPNASQAQSDRNIYRCIEKNGIPVTVVDTYKGRAELIAWKNPYPGYSSRWTPKRKCEEVSRRLQKFSDDNQLKYITTGQMNGYPVICVGEIKSVRGYSCINEGLLITLHKGEDADQELQSLFQQATQIVSSPVSYPPDAQFTFNITSYLANYPYPESFTDERYSQQSTPTTLPPKTQQSSSDCQGVTLFCNTTFVQNTPAPTEFTTSDRDIYSCINQNGTPLTVVDTNRGRIELIVWESNYFRASGWTPNRRCQEVTQRFQRFSDENKLTYITTGQMKGYPVICVGKMSPPQGYSCMNDSLLITLQKGENSNQVLESLFKQATQVAGGGTPVSRSPEGKYVFNIKNYLTEYPYQDSSQQGNKPKTTTVEIYPQGQKISCPRLLCED